ncbi:MAG: hypothetical protein ACE5HV_15955, partial [Acidobacteriota bacterium]
ALEPSATQSSRAIAAAQPRAVEKSGLGIYSVVSLGAAVAYILLHAHLLDQLGGLRQRGDWLIFSEQTARLFVVLHATTLSLVVITGIALAWPQVGRSQATGLERSKRRPTYGRLAAWAAAVAIVLLGGLWLPRSAHLRAIEADIFFKQAKAATAAGSYGASVALHQRAITFRPGEDSYRYGLGNAFLQWAEATEDPEMRETRFGRAADHFREAAELSPLNAAHEANLARLFLRWGTFGARPAERQEKWRDAERHYRRAVELQPRSARYYAESARLAQLRGDNDLALQRFRQSLALDPTEGETYLWLAGLLERRGAAVPGPAGAADLSDPGQLLTRLPWIDLYDAYTALSAYYSQAGNLQEAILASSRMVQLRPDNPLGHRSLAHLYDRAGRTDLALAHARRALAVASGSDRRALEELIGALERRIGAQQ